MDGTLLSAKGELSARTIAAIEASRAAGIEFVAATGRSHLSAASRLVPAMPSMRWAICSNGATLYDLHEQRVVTQYTIADEHLQELEAVWPGIDGLALAWEAVDGFGATAAYLHRHPWGLADVKPSVHPPRTGVVKLLVSTGDLAGAALIDYVQSVAPAGLEVASSGAPFVEITGAGVNKAHGVSRLAGQLAIAAAATMVFGDNNNDLSMFAWAGHAVAMANATPEVHRAATAATAHHDEDGVAQAVEALLAG
jgi:Cof subfamily protein (haloacid dehalogenase superfamily)